MSTSGKVVNRPRRGLKDLRTMMDLKTDTGSESHRFIRMAMLAIQKARLSKEADSARQKIADIDTRVTAIEEEMKALLREGQTGQMDVSQDRVPSTFKIKY